MNPLKNVKSEIYRVGVYCTITSIYYKNNYNKYVTLMNGMRKVKRWGPIIAKRFLQNSTEQ